MFEQVSQVFEQVSQVFEQMRQVFEQVSQVFDQVHQVFEQVRQVSEEVSQVFEQVSQVFEQVSQVFEQLSKAMGLWIRLNGRVGSRHSYRKTAAKLLNGDIAKGNLHNIPQYQKSCKVKWTVQDDMFLYIVNSLRCQDLLLAFPVL